MPSPQVSIIMATYNRSHFIGEALKSIMQQTFINFECLIIDDGSTDNSETVIRSIIKEDARFKYYLRNENYSKGLPGARNFGLDYAAGKYIIFFDDDDVIHPNNLEIGLQAFSQYETDFVHYQKLSFNETINIPLDKQVLKYKQNLSSRNIEAVVKNEIGLASCTVLWNSKCFHEIRFNETLHYAEEWECYIRILLNGHRGIIIENILYFNRKHNQSNTYNFHSHNPEKKFSNNHAIQLVLQQIKEKKLLTYSLKRHFVFLALMYKEYDLFSKSMQLMNLSDKEKLLWYFFYSTLPLRLTFTRFRKKIKVYKFLF